MARAHVGFVTGITTGVEFRRGGVQDKRAFCTRRRGRRDRRLSRERHRPAVRRRRGCSFGTACFVRTAREATAVTRRVGAPAVTFRSLGLHAENTGR